MSHLYDVAIVGYGPVGQATAALLGKKGHRVVVLERHADLYRLARAGHIDDEIARIFQGIGIIEGFEATAVPLEGISIIGADGEPSAHVNQAGPGASGWHRHYLMYQRNVEDLLHATVLAQPSVDVHLGYCVEDVIVAGDPDSDAAAVLVRAADAGTGDTIEFQAKFVIGCDGANSAVRRLAGLDHVEDLGFSEEWLVIDVLPNPGVVFDVPQAEQWCDPNRPASIFGTLGVAHSRWEFMLLPGESAEEISTESRCFELMAPWGPGPDNCTIVRRSVYRFQSKLAQRFSGGRIILAGDSAHVMPPFLGQGLCSGFRDAVNLAWRMDLLLSGVAGPKLLESYTTERRPHVESIIRESMGLGSIVCTTDPELAAQRDELMRASGEGVPDPVFTLSEGVLQRGVNRHQAVGHLTPQGVVVAGSRAGRFDDVLGAGWWLLVAPDLAEEPLEPILENLDIDQDLAGVMNLRTARLAPAGSDRCERVLDIEGRYAEWFARLGVSAALIRPDFYAFGFAQSVEEIPSLVGDLVAQVNACRPVGSVPFT